jgi:conjugal transfer/type IV secretion protein DotA/TraY
MKKVYNYIISAILLVVITSSPTIFAFEEEQESINDPTKAITQDDILFNNLQGLVGQTANIVTGGALPQAPDHILAILSDSFNYGLLGIAIILMVTRGFFWMLSLNSDKEGDNVIDFQNAPLIIGMSLILLLPMKNGYSVIQHVVIYSGGYSIGLSNIATVKAAEFLQESGSYAPSSVMLDTEQYITQMFASSACLQLFNYTLQKKNVSLNAKNLTDGGSSSYNLSYDGIHSHLDVAAAYVMEFTELYSNGVTVRLPDDVCGTFNITYASYDLDYGLTGALGEFRLGMNEVLTKAAQEINVLAIDYTMQMLTPLKDFTYPLMHEQSTVTELKKITLELRTQYKFLLKSLVANFSPENLPTGSTISNYYSVEQLKKYGTAYLGIYFWEFSERQQVFSNMSKATITYEEPKGDIINLNIDKTVLDKSNIFLKNFFDDFGANDGSSIPGQAEGVGKFFSIKELTASLESPDQAHGFIAASIKAIFVGDISETSNPILGMVRSANTLLDFLEFTLLGIEILKRTSYVAEVFLEATKEGAEQAGIFGAPAVMASYMSEKTLQKLGEFLVGLQELLWPVVLGLVFIAFWIPLLPLIHWISGLMGFFIVFTQALILTPLLALSHLMSTEKTFLNSKTQHGYMSIIQLLTYLPIMVISFFIAYFIGTIGLKLLNILYIPAISRVEHDWLGVIKLVVYIFAYYIIAIQLLNRAFSLITSIPEKAGKYIGGGEEMLGDSTEQSKSSFVAIGNNVRSGAGKVKELQAATKSNNINEKKGMSGIDQKLTS